MHHQTTYVDHRDKLEFFLYSPKWILFLVNTSVYFLFVHKATGRTQLDALCARTLELHV